MTRDTKQHYILFEISSRSIATLVFERSTNAKTKKNNYKQVFSTRSNISKKHETNFDLFFQKTLKTFQAVAELAHFHSGNDIAEIYINVAAPWASSQKRILHFEKEKEFIFTKDIQATILKKDSLIATHRTHDFKDKGELEIIEQEVLDIFANGYRTKHPYQTPVTDIDVHSLSTMMSMKTHHAFNHVIEKVFHRDAVFFSNTFMTYRALQDLFPQQDSLTVIDISNEITEISIIINDQLQKIGSFGSGMHAIFNHISEKLHIPYAKASSLLSLYQNQHLDETYHDKIELVMKSAFMHWFRQGYDFLAQVNLEHHIPETFCILAPVEFQNWFNGFMLKTEELSEHIHNSKNIALLDLRMKWQDMSLTEFSTIDDDNLSLALYFIEKKFLITD